MDKKHKVLPEIKIGAVRDYLKGVKSVIQICHELSVGTSTVEGWIRIYRAHGEIKSWLKEERRP